jgi:putative transposase
MTRVNPTQEALCDALLTDSTDPHDLLGAPGWLKPLPPRVGERVLEAARTAPLGSALQERPGPKAGKARTGQGQQTVQPAPGPLALAVPHDRHGSVAPPLVPQRQRRWEGCDAPGGSWDARGLSPRARHGPRAALSGTAGAPLLLTTSTAAGVDAGRPWPSRPRAAVSPRRSCAALGVPSRQEGPVQPQAVSRALGLPMDGEPARLG